MLPGSAAAAGQTGISCHRAGRCGGEHHSPIWSAERQKADFIGGIGLGRLMTHSGRLLWPALDRHVDGFPLPV
jgi:hypothetical protein